MKIPSRLLPLIHADLIDDVVGQLQSGKEAEVYIVRAQGEYLCAKVYKDEKNRTFRQKTQYTEGRKVRNSRRARAMDSNSRYGKKERETEWQNTEVETLSLLAAAGVRVPRSLAYYEGVLLIEMILDSEGQPAPRLNDVDFSAELATEYYHFLVRQAVLMLCAGIVHGDYSEFNVLVAWDGPVIIDLPQAVQATANNAFAIFERDLDQLANFFSQFNPELSKTKFAKEIWRHFERGQLRPDTVLTGKYEVTRKQADVRGVLEEIEDAKFEESKRRVIKSKK